MYLKQIIISSTFKLGNTSSISSTASIKSSLSLKDLVALTALTSLLSCASIRRDTALLSSFLAVCRVNPSLKAVFAECVLDISLPNAISPFNCVLHAKIWESLLLISFECEEPSPPVTD